jgi:hypothetical protein
MTKIANDRLALMFKTNKIEDIHQKIIEFNEKLQIKPHLLRKYSKRAEKLITPKIIEILKNSAENKWFKMSVLHL